MTTQANSLRPTAILSNRDYTIVRQSATVILPAIGALYFALAQLWNLPKAEEVVGTVAALNVFAGVLTAIAQRVYNATGAKYDGSVEVEVDENGKKTFLLNVDGDLDELDKKTEIVFRVHSR